VAIQSSCSNTCIFGEVIKAGTCAGPGERLLGHFPNALAITLRIRARGFRRMGCERFVAMIKNICNRRHPPVILSTVSETLSVLFEVTAGRQYRLQ
jgi:hypothetical protein